MTEEGAAAAGDSSSAARVKSSFAKVGDRTRFTVELRPGETTIVSWKKLMKDAAKADGVSFSSTTKAAAAAASVAAAAAPEPPTNAHPSLESRLAPGQPATNELKDAAPPNRFSAVIEKIERLYMGKDSSDEEDLDDIPDDDQYDTEDSFIDDAELDEYFEVDKSKTKHDGYFVNRGTLEKISEPLVSANQQPKKRRRREMAKAPGDDDNGHRPGKHLKVGKKGAGRSMLSVEKHIVPASQGPVKNLEEMKIQGQVNASGTFHQNVGRDGKSLLDISQPLRSSNGDASSYLADSSEKQKTGLLAAKNHSSKLKENNPEEFEVVIQQKDKSGMRERIDLNLPDNKQTVQHIKKPKASSLEKAIRELEKMVAESRPPAVDAQDADGSSQSIKRRLPREIKLKLAKVARLAYASNGKVSKEVLNRLMGILGHIIQIRTLKRHLKVMMNTSLSAKQEKDDKFQQIKKEVIEMVKARVPSIMSKAAELQSGGSGDIQESGHSDKASKVQIYMDATLEDKICDLYDIFVDGLDEDAAPQVRKLYAELAELWPKGVMDNHGIKRAICRAKERKRALNERNKEKEKIRRKKLAATKIEDTVHTETSAAAQPQFVELRLGTSDPGIAVVSQPSRFISSTTGSATGTQVGPTHVAPLPAPNVLNFERSKQDKMKGMQNSSLTEMRSVDGVALKKKVKRKTENLVDGHLRPEKLSSLHGDDKQKLNKHASTPLQSTPHKSSYEEFRFGPLT